MPTVDIYPATAARFPDLRDVLGPRVPDAPACWCLAYRVSSAENHALRGADRANRLLQMCQRPDAPGVIGYVDGVPAGWCSFGPRSDMGRLVRSRTIPSMDDLPVWSIVCFVVKPPHRRQGLSRSMLDAAVAYARERGVQTLEAYPVDRQGRRISATAAFVGTTDLFEAAGFVRVQATLARSGGLTRWLVRRDLSD